MPRLLLIEDDCNYADALLRRLQRHHWAGAHYLTPTEALTDTLPVNAIVLDQNLAGQSSLPCIPTLKARWPQARLIVVTGYASIATTVSAIKDGADNYLTKPVDLATLVRELQGDNTSAASMPEQPISVDALEWELIHQTLAAHDNNISATARALNMHRRTLQRKLQKKRPQ